jgi:hypothetical protein
MRVEVECGLPGSWSVPREMIQVGTDVAGSGGSTALTPAKAGAESPPPECPRSGAVETIRSKDKESKECKVIRDFIRQEI